MVDNAYRQVSFDGRTHSRSRGLCLRLRSHDDDGTGDAVLQVNALLFAPSARDGLLQDHAIDACSFCAIFIGASVVLTRCIRGDAGFWRTAVLGFLFFLPCRRARPRPADFLRTGRSPSSHLALQSFPGPRIRVLGNHFFAGGTTREISKVFWARTRPMAGVHLVVLCFKSQSAGAGSRNGPATVSWRRTHIL